MNGTVRSLIGNREATDRMSVLVIGGMQSAACVSRVEKALLSVAGVETAGVNLLTRLATVRHSLDVKPQALIEAVSKVGYEGTLASPSPDARRGVTFGETIDVIASRKSRFVAGAIFTMLILIINQIWASPSIYQLLILFLLATPVQITVGWEYYRGFIHALRNGQFNMDSLVVLGSTAAYLQGFLCFIGEVSGDHELMRDPQFHTAAMILTVVSLGKWLEARARDSTSQLWGSLIEMTPKEACVLRDGREQTIPAGVVAVGDIVIVRPGEKIPVDGEIIEGGTEVNEALITGEGRPVPKVKGDRVIVASLNGSGFIKVRAIGVGANSTLAQIAKMVTDAQDRKANVEQMADRISAVLVPVTIVIAVLAFATWYFGPIATKAMLTRGWLSESWTVAKHHLWYGFLFQEPSISVALRPLIAVLVVACPCALGLATPTAVIVATGLGARRGILFKGGEAIEAASTITDVVFDKTGTLTDGSFEAEEVLTAPKVDRDELLILAGSLEACSEHALAKGVVREAKKSTLQLRKVDNFEPLPGRGLQGRIGKKGYLLGSRELVTERGYKLKGKFAEEIEAAEKSGNTLIFLAEEGGSVLGALALADRIKESSKPAIDELRAMNLTVHLLSGDNTFAAQAVGKQCGLREDEVHALMKPEDKVQFARELKAKGKHIAIVGDGINDAPALAAADVGFALGTGTDIAVESGQIVLVSPDVRGVGKAIALARQAARTINWNLLWAFSFNLVMIPLAFFNKLDPTLGASAMALSSILVVLNSLRLTYTKRPDMGPVLILDGKAAAVDNSALVNAGK